jgi:elongation factor P
LNSAPLTCKQLCGKIIQILFKVISMATIGMGDIKKNVRLEISDVPYKVVEFQHVKPGKGAAFVRMKVKSFINGKVIEKTVHAGDKFEVPVIEYKTMQYLYDDGEMLQFMDNDTYDQIGLTYDQCEDAMKWLKDGISVDMVFYKGDAISVSVPETMELVITDTPPNFKGDTSSGSRKPATLETGAVVQVPYHILEGDTIKVNTVDGEYLEKVK